MTYYVLTVTFLKIRTSLNKKLNVYKKITTISVVNVKYAHLNI